MIEKGFKSVEITKVSAIVSLREGPQPEVETFSFKHLRLPNNDMDSDTIANPHPAVKGWGPKNWN